MTAAAVELEERGAWWSIGDTLGPDVPPPPAAG